MDDAQEEGMDSAEGALLEMSLLKSEDSQNYENERCILAEDSVDGHSCGSWDDGSYYNVCPNLDYEPTYEPVPPILSDILDESLVTGQNVAVEYIDMIDETLEENNNDPNNNMDSIETSEERAELEEATNMEYMGPVERAESPKPGCSRNSLPPSPIADVRDNSADNVVHVRTNIILGLLSKITKDSAFEGLKKNRQTPFPELKLWDLIPENERNRYSPRDARDASDANKAELAREPMTEQGPKNDESNSAVANSVKRRPADDICTVGCKKSSSDSKIVAAAPPSLPKIMETVSTMKNPTISQIPVVATSSTAALSQQSHRTSAADIRHLDVAFHNQRFGFRHSRNGPTASGNDQTHGAVSKQQPQTNAIANAQVVQTGNGAIPKVRVNDRRVVVPFVTHCNQQQQVVSAFDKTTGNIVSRGAIPKVVAVDRRNLHGNASQGRSSTVVVTAASRIAHINDNRPTSAHQQNRVEQKVHSVAHRSPPESQRPREDMPSAAISASNRVDECTQSQHRQRPCQRQETEQRKQETERVICMDIYYKLRNIFPSVEPNYIKSLCPADWGPGDRDAQLSTIIEHLLEKGDTLPMIPEPIMPDNGAAGAIGQGDEIAGSCGDVDDIYETLLGIFPDADPHYLREFAEKNVGRPNAVKEFVDSKFESRDYPTREQYLARLKITEQQKQYTTGFNVKQFLTIIPDPFKYFLDPSRKCRHSTVAFEFLKSHFNKIRVSQISKTYREYRENLSLTSAALESIHSEMKSKRARPEMPTEDILLLQEIAFIKHKSEISEYIENVRRSELEEFEMFKKDNMLVECQCCFDNECVPSKCSSCDNGHLFCNSCVITGTSTKMGEDQTRISCFVNCGSEFSLSVLQRVLAPTTFSILLKKRQAAEVIEAGLEGLVSCPFCHFASIPPEGDKVFKCLNPECTKESCRMCKELSHVPFKCGEIMKADKARRYIEERMTEALARKCYKCNRSFFKEEGCNKINCPCGAMMCYLCDQPIKDYNHFRGQGSNDKNLCPLYTDDKRLDAVAVRKVAEQAEKEILKLDPSVRIDTTKLLPNIPQPTRGPHTDVLNADELPQRRAQRVLENQPQL